MKMLLESSLFVRSLALAGDENDANCLTSASRTPSDGTFAISHAKSGTIRIYAASCAALLHEFTTIHRVVHALHYTSFSDSLVTLETDGSPLNEADDDDQETYLCVYHDWRANKLVRGYKLPLGVLENPLSMRKADCMAVCSFTGRVVVAMGTVINIWQCSQGFFEHVMEIQVDLSVQYAYRHIEYVAIHGVYVAYATSTEVRVMEIHVRNLKSSDASPQLSTTVNLHQEPHDSSSSLPVDAVDCIRLDDVMNDIPVVQVPSSLSYNRRMNANEVQEDKLFEEQHDQVPVVHGRNEAQQEAWVLAGLIKSQDLRVNRALAYSVGENDVKMLLRRFLPPNHAIRSLKFLPETIDNRISIEARSYTRLLITTKRDAFLYYFLSEQVDSTRKRMAKKVLGRADRSKTRQLHAPIRVKKKHPSKFRGSFASTSTDNDDVVSEDDVRVDEDDQEEDEESGRVVFHYALNAPIVCVAANSSFLFVATHAELQVWSIWSPCHHIAASRALSSSLVPRPAQPRRLCAQTIPFAPSQIAALDSYVVLLPETKPPSNLLRTASLLAPFFLPEAEVELRRHSKHRVNEKKVLILQQTPSSLVFSRLRQQNFLSCDQIEMEASERIDLLLSLFSLYRYRADVGASVLEAQRHPLADTKPHDRKDWMALELETKLYDVLARECAADLAKFYTNPMSGNLNRAALLFVASNVPSNDVLSRFQSIMAPENRQDVTQAISKYLEAFVFASNELLPALGSRSLDDSVKSTESTGFTRVVVLHYGTYAPEQLCRLIIDSSLVWTLEDLEHGWTKLSESAQQDSTSMQLAQLMLILRATVMEHKATSSEFLRLCTYESFKNKVQLSLKRKPQALVQLCVNHSEVLIQRSSDQAESKTSKITASFLAQAIEAHSPTIFLKILTKIFHRAIERQEPLLSIFLFCLSTIGIAAEPTRRRISTMNWSMATPNPSVFQAEQAIVVRFLMFLLETFPSLLRLAEQAELVDDEDEVLRVQSMVAMEFLFLCVTLSTTFARNQPPDQTKTTKCTRTSLLRVFHHHNKDQLTTTSQSEWVHEYLQSRCVPLDDHELQHLLTALYKQALSLLDQSTLIPPKQLLEYFQSTSSTKRSQVRRTKARQPTNWTIESDLAMLIVLLTLPRVSRTMDGLDLLSQQNDLLHLFLPYGKSFCHTLDEWKHVITTLSAISESTNYQHEEDSEDEVLVLERVLTHVCSTLGPEELLDVLPDDGDLALFIATLETSVRLDVANDPAAQRHASIP